MIYDVTLLLGLMRSFPSGILEMILHHLFSIYGAIVGILCGRFLGVLMSTTILTEFSTPFVNLRWLLYFHKKTHLKVYMINGWLMTITFFIFRICLCFYLIFWICYPGWMNLDWSEDSGFFKFLVTFSTMCYPLLYLLNIYWFTLMIKGALKLMTSGKDVKLDGKSESVVSRQESRWPLEENFEESFRQYNLSIVQFKTPMDSLVRSLTSRDRDRDAFTSVYDSREEIDDVLLLN